MADIWGSIKNTGDALGGAVVAPLGAVWDIANLPFDDKDDDFGSVLGAVGDRGGDVLNLLVGDNLIGDSVSGVLEGMNTALDYGVNRPLSSLLTMGTVADVRGIGSFFDGGAWSDAWDVSDDQSAGQSFAFMFHDRESDPLRMNDQGIRPYDEFYKDHTILAPTLSWGANILGAWYLDPFVLAGKGLGAIQQTHRYGKLDAAQKAEMGALLSTSPRTRARTDDFLGYINGKNPLGRPLEAPEIMYGTRELNRWMEPEAAQKVSGLLAEARILGDPAKVANAQRDIIAIAAGDVARVQKLRDEVTAAPHLADRLTNMMRNNTLNLERLAADPVLKHHPVFIKQVEKQLDNLNADGGIDKFIDQFTSRVGMLVGREGDSGIAGSLTHLPGAHTSAIPGVKGQSDRAVRRIAGEDAPRKATDNLYSHLGEWGQRVATRREAASGIFQKGAYTMPLMVIKTAGLAGSVYTKGPLKAIDALRTTHFTGVAHIHDWGSTTTQLDSMMKLSGAAHGERMQALSRAFLASSEIEKKAAIEVAERVAMKGLVARASERAGAKVDSSYVERLMSEYVGRRAAGVAQVQGRAYAATRMSDEMSAKMDAMVATRGANMQKAEDVADTAAAKAGGQATVTEAPKRWTVDQWVDEFGMPVHMPLLESELVNSVPLLDVHLASKLIDRDTGRLARFSQSWVENGREIERLSNLKGVGGRAVKARVESLHAAQDWLVEMGGALTRVWKMSVLFRLGYPMRVVLDDQWRIWSRIGAMSQVANIREAGRNIPHNQIGRRVQARRELATARMERHELKGRLDSEEMLAFAGRKAEYGKVTRSLATHRAQLAKLNEADAEKIAAKKSAIAEAEAEQAYLREQLGDMTPADIEKRIAELDEIIDAGPKALMEAKRHIGESPLQLDEGVSIEGAFQGAGGRASREASGSSATFDYDLKSSEELIERIGHGGSYRTISPTENGHLGAWKDVVNYQFRNSQVAMFFVKGGDRDGFVRWIKQPEQAPLRKRLPHYAHDPEDWGARVEEMVLDYLPTKELRDAVAAGNVTAKQLDQMLAREARPAVHGRAVADSLGSSHRALGVGRTFNRVFRYLAEVPTDTLSRHPFFNSMYKIHAKEQYEILKVAKAKGLVKDFGPEDLERITTQARKMALADVRKTLYDLSAHSNAAHAMRFLSPFFGAHQETIRRWWEIVSDSPHIVRRFTQAFELPIAMNLVYDTETGEMVKPGDAIDPTRQKLLLQMPKDFGGKDPELYKSKWQIGLNSFNLVLQGGLANPGAGPVVTAPVDYFARKYADQPGLAKVAEVFNPYPGESALDNLTPAVGKRFAGVVYGYTGVELPIIGDVGVREFNDRMAQNMQDELVQYRLDHNGANPSWSEYQELEARAGELTRRDVMLRFFWNAGSPFPATPSSRFSAIQTGWRQIQDQARAEGHDFEWALEVFKERYDDVYLPLIYSSSSNDAGLAGTPAEVRELRRYRPVLQKIDPSLTRMLTGAYADAAGGEMGDYSKYASLNLKGSKMSEGSSATYWDTSEPGEALDKQMARLGWGRYSELTAGLQNMAEQQGLTSYRESDALMKLKTEGVKAIQADNWAFAREWNTFDPTEYDRHLQDMERVAETLAKDPVRTDGHVLGQYLAIRKVFSWVLGQREASGLGGVQAQANKPILEMFASYVDQLVASNTMFQEYMYDGVIERDPYLREAEAA